MHREPRRDHIATLQTRGKGSLAGLTSWQGHSRRARKETRNKNSSSAMHISIWMFLNGHDVQRASFDPWILSFRETNPLCCKNNNSWFYLHLRTKSPCLLPLSTRNAPWTQARDPESPNRTLSTWEKTLIPESLPKRKFCHFWISASKQNKKAAFLNFLLISCKSQERKILISAT